jgi:hypothetical protein
MQKYDGQLLRKFQDRTSGIAYEGISIEVRNAQTNNLALLYNDADGVSPKANPLTSDENGYYSFYAADGRYKIIPATGSPQLDIQLQDIDVLKDAFDNAVSVGGYIPFGTFSAGATLTQSNQILSDGSTYWKWDGALPKTVTAGSSPTPTGLGGWIVLSDQALRGDLAASNSTVLIAGVEADDVASLRGDLATPGSTVSIGGTASGLVGKVVSLFVTPEMFGAAGNGAANDSIAIKSWLESPLKKIAKRGAVYNLGTIAGDAALASTTGIDHDIDFNFCKFVCAGDVSSAFTDTTMLKVTNGRLSVKNLAGFNDTTFTSRGAGRGVAPWIVINSGVSTSGYLFDNITLENCQSFGTFASSNHLHQARGISFNSCVATGNVERGLTLSASGSNIDGSLNLSGNVNRCIYAQDVSNVDLTINGGSPQASSGNVLIIASAGVAVSNIKLSVNVEQIYSVSIVAKDSTSAFNNIDIDVFSKTIPDALTEVIRFGAQDSGGLWLATSSFSAKNISFKIRSNTINYIEFGMQTYSANVGIIKLDVFGDYSFYNKGVGMYFQAPNQVILRQQNLTSNAVPIRFSTGVLQKNVSRINYELSVRAYGGGSAHVAKYFVSAFKAADGSLSSVSSTLIYQQNTGLVSSAISSAADDILATFSGFTGAIEAYISVNEIDY